MQNASGKQVEIGKTNTSGKDAFNPTTYYTTQYFIPLNYDIVEDMKKTKANISLYELAHLTSHKNLLFKAFRGVRNNATATNRSTTGLEATQTNQSDLTKVPNPLSINNALIGHKSRSQTAPFLLTFEVYNNKLHNCLVDYGASINVIPYVVFHKLNA